MDYFWTNLWKVSMWFSFKHHTNGLFLFKEKPQNKKINFNVKIIDTIVLSEMIEHIID
jgi:hypothetical protein